VHETLRRLHGSQRGSGTVLDRFRLNEVVSQIAFGGRRGRVYRQLVAVSGVRPGDAVLDVGCSSGYLARKLAVAVGAGGHVTGVDPSRAAITDARRRAGGDAYGAGGGAMTFAVGVAQDLPLPDEASFDVVTCTLAIHHVPARQRSRAFEEMYRVIKPGGRLLAADIDATRPPLPLHPGARRTWRAAASVGPLQGLAAAAGFRIESTGELPLLRYIVAVRPAAGARP
jgi:ubiquinone/menaquinone biosynthesis C-methylase UbiE